MYSLFLTFFIILQVQRSKAHCIPNIHFGSVDRHTDTFFCAPAMSTGKERGAGRDFTRDEAEMVLNVALDCVRTVVPNSYNFPPSADAESFHAHRKNGQPVHSIRPINEEYLERFTRMFLRKIRRTQMSGEYRFRDAYFIHCVKDLKSNGWTPAHNNPNSDNKARLLETVTRRIVDYHSVLSEIKNWYIDVGLTINLPDCVVLSRRDGLSRLLAFFMNISKDDAAALVSTGTSYKDIYGGFTDMAGLRIDLDGDNPLKATYVQIYCTEKQLAYLKDDGDNAKMLGYRKFFNLALNKKTKVDFLNKFLKALADASDAGDSFPLRIEFRVPLYWVFHVFENLPGPDDVDELRRFRQLVWKSVYVIPTRLWW